MYPRSSLFLITTPLELLFFAKGGEPTSQHATQGDTRKTVCGASRGRVRVRPLARARTRMQRRPKRRRTCSPLHGLRVERVEQLLRVVWRVVVDDLLGVALG